MSPGRLYPRRLYPSRLYPRRLYPRGLKRCDERRKHRGAILSLGKIAVHPHGCMLSVTLHSGAMSTVRLMKQSWLTQTCPTCLYFSHTALPAQDYCPRGNQSVLAFPHSCSSHPHTSHLVLPMSDTLSHPALLAPSLPSRPCPFRPCFSDSLAALLVSLSLLPPSHKMVHLHRPCKKNLFLAPSTHLQLCWSHSHSCLWHHHSLRC